MKSFERKQAAAEERSRKAEARQQADVFKQVAVQTRSISSLNSVIKQWAPNHPFATWSVPLMTTAAEDVRLRLIVQLPVTTASLCSIIASRHQISICKA